MGISNLINRKVLFTCTLLFILTNFIMCSSDSSKKDVPPTEENTSNRLIGTLGPDYNFGSKGKAGATDVDKIKLVLTEKGVVSWETFRDISYEFDIDENGQFSIPIQDYDTTKDWIILLMNTQAANKRDQIVGYVGMSDAQANSLLMLPMSELDETVTDDMDLGEINQNGDEALGSTTVEESADFFTLDQTKLSELARTDTFLKNLKNAYVNFDPVTWDYYFLQLSYQWIMTDINAIKNQWSVPADYAGSGGNYAGYLVSFQTNVVDDPTYAEVIDYTNGVDVEIYPPDTVTDGNITRDTSTPFANDGAGSPNEINNSFNDQWYDDDFGISDRPGTASGDPYTYRMMGPNTTDPFQGLPSTGYWRIDFDAVTVAEYDLGPTSPFDANGEPLVYIPSVRIDVDGVTNQFTSVQIKWYFYNSQSSSYEEVTDISVIDEVLWYPWFAIYSNSGAEEYQPLMTDTEITLDQPWYWFGDGNPPTVTHFYFSYKMGTINYCFSWQLP